MEREEVLQNLKEAAIYYGLLAHHLDEHGGDVIDGLLTALVYLPSTQKVVINLGEFPETAAALREMLGPFANTIEMLSIALNNISIEGDELTVSSDVPVLKLLKELGEDPGKGEVEER